MRFDGLSTKDLRQDLFHDGARGMGLRRLLQVRSFARLHLITAFFNLTRQPGYDSKQ